ncbi:MAG TPA: hypothetical protein VGV67_12415 [Solirubrobacteraceae bacterium]|nr:hypothetical protein [Solirubrobacteraceae bacterium]
MRRSFAAGMLAGFAGLTFAGEANAACKRGLTNVYKDRYIEARVVTSWCYSNGNVTTRHSRPSAKVTDVGHALGLRESAAEWTYSECHGFNGFPKHNCLTKRQFSFSNTYVPWAPKIGVCIETRIYGNGAHKRNIRGECS